MTQPVCVVDSCEKLSRPGSRTYCEMHYYRLRRTGSLDAKPWHRRTVCAVPDCVQPEKQDTYCGKHAARWRRYGHTEYVGTPPLPGEANPAWIGEAAGYFTVHNRLASVRGKASEQRCVDCGQPARHWSYDHSAPDERSSEVGPYTTDLDHYDPRCIACHRHFDRDHESPA